MKRISHAEVCPLCKGTGIYGRRIQYMFDDPSYRHVLSRGKKCHGCRGKGWVRISDVYPKKEK